jgi:hypothetical protein
MIYDQKEIQLFVSHPSWRSWRAQRLLSRKGYSFEVVDTTEDDGTPFHLHTRSLLIPPIRPAPIGPAK